MTDASAYGTTRRRGRWPLGILVGAGLVALVLMASAPPAIRVLAAAALFIVGPGLAWTPILGLQRDRLLAAVTVVTLSLSVDIIAAQAVMWLGGLRWQPVAWLLVLVTAVGAAFQMAWKDRSW